MYLSSLDGLTIHLQSSLLLKISACSDVLLSFPFYALGISSGEKFLLYRILHTVLQNLEKNHDLQYECESGAAKRSGGANYSFFTTFAVFTNSTPVLLSWWLNKIMLQKVKTLKQTKDKTKKSKKNDSMCKQINIIIAAWILRGIVIEFYETHRFTEIYLS